MSDTECIGTTNSEHNLLSLPAEIIDHVLSFLEPFDLSSLSSTCRQLAPHAISDLAWQRHIQDNVPGVRITSPVPCGTFRELYLRHDPHWFLPRYKVWFSDYFLTGKLIIVRYDPRRGCIEGYRLVAEREAPTFDPWEFDDEVLIHSFNPRCRLHLDQPILQLDARSVDKLTAAAGASRQKNTLWAETPMTMGARSPNGVFSNFMLTKPVPHAAIHPSMQVWPPRTISARQRVRNISQEAFVGIGHKPEKRHEVCNQAFRIRRWMEMSGSQNSTGVHLGEEVYTYATLDPKLYTPTEEKPWRGIWIGDFSGHGCEFLLINQPDNELPFDEASVVQKEDETTEEWETRKKEEKIYRGSMEAIKLTGDPNVPRGEYTFVADDISSEGYIRTVTEDTFKGSRIVKSRGHIAARMFRNGKSTSLCRC
jgi:Cyclin D1 binding domain/F-box-like